MIKKGRSTGWREENGHTKVYLTRDLDLTNSEIVCYLRTVYKQFWVQIYVYSPYMLCPYWSYCSVILFKLWNCVLLKNCVFSSWSRQPGWENLGHPSQISQRTDVCCTGINTSGRVSTTGLRRRAARTYSRGSRVLWMDQGLGTDRSGGFRKRHSIRVSRSKFRTLEVFIRLSFPTRDPYSSRPTFLTSRVPDRTYYYWGSDL